MPFRKFSPNSVTRTIYVSINPLPTVRDNNRQTPPMDACLCASCDRRTRPGGSTQTNVPRRRQKAPRPGTRKMKLLQHRQAQAKEPLSPMRKRGWSIPEAEAVVGAPAQAGVAGRINAIVKREETVGDPTAVRVKGAEYEQRRPRPPRDCHRVKMSRTRCPGLGHRKEICCEPGRI